MGRSSWTHARAYRISDPTALDSTEHFGRRAPFRPSCSDQLLRAGNVQAANRPERAGIRPRTPRHSPGLDGTQPPSARRRSCETASSMAATLTIRGQPKAVISGRRRSRPSRAIRPDRSGRISTRSSISTHQAADPPPGRAARYRSATMDVRPASGFSRKKECRLPDHAKANSFSRRRWLRKLRAITSPCADIADRPSRMPAGFPGAARYQFGPVHQAVRACCTASRRQLDPHPSDHQPVGYHPENPPSTLLNCPVMIRLVSERNSIAARRFLISGPRSWVISSIDQISLRPLKFLGMAVENGAWHARIVLTDFA